METHASFETRASYGPALPVLATPKVVNQYFCSFIFLVRNIPDPEGQVMFRWSSFILGAFLACLGLLLTWWGYRRWLVADFDWGR